MHAGSDCLNCTKRSDSCREGGVGGGEDTIHRSSWKTHTFLLAPHQTSVKFVSIAVPSHLPVQLIVSESEGFVDVCPSVPVSKLEKVFSAYFVEVLLFGGIVWVDLIANVTFQLH